MFNGWSREIINYPDLVENVGTVESAIAKLEVYLANQNIPHSLNMKKGHIEHIIEQMVQIGDIVPLDPRYMPINEFYLKVFEKEAPASGRKIGVIQSHERP